jgi:RNA 2',3'-cyclic 3'-phosphodiesterase
VIRAFIAVDLDPHVIENICRAMDTLKERIPGIRWLPKTSLHLTVKFLGNIEASQVEPIGKALRHALKAFPRCTINAKGLGVFPDFRRAKILWVGTRGDRLVQLAATVESALLPLGFPPEKRIFTPHLTIGRWREGDRPPKSLRQEIENSSHFEFGACVVEQIVLFESVLKPEGASYNQLTTVQLRAT